MDLFIEYTPINLSKGLVLSFKDLVFKDLLLSTYWNDAFARVHCSNQDFNRVVDNFVDGFIYGEEVGCTYDIINISNRYLVFVMCIEDVSNGCIFKTKGGNNMSEMNRLDLDRQTSFGDICLKLKDLYTEKNRRYNDSFHKQFEEFGLTSAVMRLNDKMLRLKQLVKNPDDCGDEPIVDTLKDMANYAIMTLMELEPVEEDRDIEDLDKTEV